ncbi:AraC family transcriptional regulator [Lachnoclostridium sp. An169]|uniref:helix-turn-helix domain-containing protein n=1 Tax=Lachnoclostridium sp. An169 TaxID=1965569 RepID=UPI000B3A3CE8|nr:AraC family transcriptional regulator [Lachnoclostridium sp. An169]OUP80568.1 AraC family transcriptional regulator [Lachnoclostridium sp. An169]HJA64700.1 AraC family transcriptional regulator [Candidatus Mediterraneibacter cottocaccae]
MNNKEKPHNKKISYIGKAIDYIEARLDSHPDLDTVAAAVHYSKYHLHRMFTETVGMTIHDYTLRRRLTEAAKLLVFSERPILDIALICGYESRQAFTLAFKEMYKVPPGEYRKKGEFYPLLLRFSLCPETAGESFSAGNIRLADPADIPAWMELVRMVVDGYPHFHEEEYLPVLKKYISQAQALILETGGTAIGVMLFSRTGGSIDFMGIHPQYRRQKIQELFLERLIRDFLPRCDISTTTYRRNDRADNGYRRELLELGFAERELLTEFGYPTQRFILQQRNPENLRNPENRETISGKEEENRNDKAT